MYMEDNNLKQYETAEALSVAPAVLNKWLKKSTNPHDSTVIDLADKLGYQVTKHIDGCFYFKEEVPKEVAKTMLRSNIEELQQIASELTDKDLQIRMLTALNNLSNERARLFEEISSIKSKIINLR